MFGNGCEGARSRAIPESEELWETAERGKMRTTSFCRTAVCAVFLCCACTWAQEVQDLGVTEVAAPVSAGVAVTGTGYTEILPSAWEGSGLSAAEVLSADAGALSAAADVLSAAEPAVPPVVSSAGAEILSPPCPIRTWAVVSAGSFCIPKRGARKAAVSTAAVEKMTPARAAFAANLMKRSPPPLRPVIVCVINCLESFGLFSSFRSSAMISPVFQVPLAGLARRARAAVRQLLLSGALIV